MAIDDLNVGPQKFEPFPAVEEPPPKGKGCLFWGCLISSILFVLLIVAIVVGLFALRRVSINAIKQYTQEQPVKLPELAIGEQEAADIKKRWEDFQAAVEQGQAARLELTGDELNSILFSDAAEMKDKVYLRIEGDKLRGDVSFPAGPIGDFLKTKELEGRYFNATGDFEISLTNGRLGVYLTDASVKGEKLPADVATQLKTQNLAEEWARQPDNNAMLQKLESIKLEDGKLILESRGAAGEEPAKAETTTDAAPEAEAQPEAETTPAPEAEAEAKPEAEAAPAEAPAAPETPATPEAPTTPEGSTPEAPAAPEAPAPQAA